MGGLSASDQNRLFILCLGISAIAVVGLIKSNLLTHLTTVEVTPPPEKTQYITQSTEDALKPSTIAKLIESHNYQIRSTGQRIVVDRALHDDATIDAVLHEVTSPIYARREQGIRALVLLYHSNKVTKILDQPKVYAAIVRCLCYGLELEGALEQFELDWDNFDFRDSVEQSCIVFLMYLALEYEINGILKSGFVPKWLAKQNWGDAPEQRQEMFDAYCSQDFMLLQDESALSALLLQIAMKDEGFQQLKAAGLVKEDRNPNFRTAAETETAFTQLPRGPHSSERQIPPQHPPTHDMESIFSRTNTGLGLEAGPRMRDQSEEERTLRRRHREAMVLNDGVAPVGVGDIIERLDSFEAEGARRRRTT